MQSWTVCGSRRGVDITRCREFVVVGAGTCWSTARLAFAAAARPAGPRQVAVTAPMARSRLIGLSMLASVGLPASYGALAHR